jgi:hypothetical protein
LNPDLKFVHWLALGIVFIVCFFAASTIIGITMLITGAQTAQHFSDNNLAATKYAIDKTYNWSTQLKDTWDEMQAIAWAAYQAGNISMAQYQDLCRLYTGMYSPLIQNTTQNFQDLLNEYLEANNELFKEYANAYGFSSSWSNILQWLIIFAIVVFALYAVYALLLRKKGGAGGITYIVKR